MIGYYNYTVILTYIGTVLGFMGVIFVWNDNIKMALICLMIAGFCDMFDGTVASIKERTKEEKRFGIQIDSLSDLICFGLLPAFIVHSLTDIGLVNHIVPIGYLLCSLIRLAWFNVDEEERQDAAEGKRSYYSGLPVTSVALILPLVMGIGTIGLPVEKIAVWIMCGVAVAFLTPFKLKKPAVVGKTIMIILGAAGFTVTLLGV